MSTEKSLSLDIYQYLCHKIGYEDEVKVRRLTYILNDIGIAIDGGNKITSGSSGEGLQLKGSDLDIMYINSLFKVFESERDVDPHSGPRISLVMDTEDTHTCFTQLRILDNHDFTFKLEIIGKMFLGRKFSSELFRRYYMEKISSFIYIARSLNIKMHGPCISNLDESHDYAICLKCDKWISQAQHWIIRPRTTWPSPDLISKIKDCGVLFVPIGYKGSSNECLQWRISFSVAEKFLIFSFNHIQLLCYALLKVLVKEIVEKHEDLKDLLCSYFVKTLMFWILEESVQSMWRPDTIIPCFKACFKRLIYCVEYSTLLHYFIPDNNLFYLRFDVDKKDKITSILKNLYDKGIYCFAQSETLYDVLRLPLNSTDSPIIRRVASLHEIMKNVFITYDRPLSLLYYFLHYSRSKISQGIFFEMLSFAYNTVPQISQTQHKSNNKIKYYKYKRDRSHLLIGTNSDAVGGWLMLASFFYVHGNYLLSLYIINHTLRKCTNEKIYPWQIGLNQNQIYLLHLLKGTKFSTILKNIRIKYPKFQQKSPISPPELQLNEFEATIPFHSIVFAHFLSFLCYYHLHEIRSCKQSLLQLEQTIMQHLTSNRCHSLFGSFFHTCLGITHQMIGETYQARQYFHRAYQLDEHSLTSAAIRLSNCNVD